ncbi:thiamine pyrophosphate enzyme [Xylariaceae sp. FL0594]|nr:thiamine pyrophosphate enzyme [Xylariaceae sp. FL0594]
MHCTALYTTAFALFEALWEAGITTCFVNLGNDHPSILEAIVKGKRERPDRWPRMITCPSEITAISMADGGVHNACVGRASVLIFSGLCPSTESGELPGSRTEYAHWLQEPHDQKAIVRQYCRYTVARALQFACTAPKGPAYVVATREVLAEELMSYSLHQDQWGPVGPGALPADAAYQVASALAQLERPLIITGYSGRDWRNPEALVALADCIPGLRVHDTGGSEMCFPASHIAWEGFRLANHACSTDADVILVLDCDVPWIPVLNAPRSPGTTRIYHIDSDPLNQQILVSFFPAHGRWKADSFTAIGQLVDVSRKDYGSLVQRPEYAARKAARASAHSATLADIASRVRLREDTDVLDVHNIGHLLKTYLPDSTTTFVVEAVTSAQSLSDQLQCSRPGSWINCGGTVIGWSNGAALGVRLALTELAERDRNSSTTTSTPRLVCQVVGDGSFMCAAPSTALWVASKYKIPILTVVLNNGGWKGPRDSARIVYPDGLNASATDEEVNTSLRPTPDYAALAEAAAGSEVGWSQTVNNDLVANNNNDNNDNTSEHHQQQQQWMQGVRVKTVAELRRALQRANTRVADEGRGMLIETFML